MKYWKFSTETQYNGTAFRSKTEAIWARILDSYGIRWQYEPETHDIFGTWYMPDFWLGEIKTWMEVKGVWDDDDIYNISGLWLKQQQLGNMVVAAMFDWDAKVPFFGVVHEHKGVLVADFQSSCMARCRNCGRSWFFVALKRSHNLCMSCQAYERGERHMMNIIQTHRRGRLKLMSKADLRKVEDGNYR